MTKKDIPVEIAQLTTKVKRLEKRIEEVRTELLIDIGRFQATSTLFTEELSKLKARCKPR